MDGTPTQRDTTIPVEEPAIACSLSPAAADAQLGEWHELVGSAERVEQLPDGARLTLPAAAAGAVADLVARERACCSFLTITTEVGEHTVIVDVTSSHRNAAAVIDALTDGGER